MECGFLLHLHRGFHFDPPLLRYPHQGRSSPVKKHSSREAKAYEYEEKRHEPIHELHGGIARSAHLLLEPGKEADNYHKEKVAEIGPYVQKPSGICRYGIENLGKAYFISGNPKGGSHSSIEGLIKVNAEKGKRFLSKLKGLVKQFLVVQNPEKKDKDRKLYQQRKTSRRRIDVVLLVKLHGFLVELFFIVGVFLLQNLQSWLKFLHLLHAYELLMVEGMQQNPNQNRKQNDRQPVGMGKTIKKVQDIQHQVCARIPYSTHSGSPSLGLIMAHAIEISLAFPGIPCFQSRFKSFFGGTGSYPPGCHGAHRHILRNARKDPRKKPKRSMAV